MAIDELIPIIPMSQSAVTHTNQTAPTQGLKPSLQAVLGCLDLQLDEELARYRRLKAGYSAPPRRVLGQRSPIVAPVELWHPTTASAPGTTVVASPPAPAPNMPPTSARAPSPAPAPPPPASPVSAPPINPFVAPNSPSPALASEARLSSPASPAAPGTLALVPPNPEVASPPDLALATVPPPTPETTLPDDYLASSEALLQSLAAEEAQADRLDPSQIKNRSGLLSPLGLGSLLLLLLSSLSLGYALLNPDSLRFLNPNLQGRELPTQSPAVAPTTLPNVPNLAADEFVDLNLDTLGTLTVPSPSPTLAPSASPTPNASPTPSPSAASPSPGANPLTAPTATPTTPIPTIPLRVVQPQVVVPSPMPATRTAAVPRSQSVPPPRSTPTTPTSPLPTLAIPATSAPPRVPVVTPTAPTTAASTRSQPDTYNVVTEYRGNESLSQLQQVAPGAYLRNFNDGIRVQLGTFDDRASAQEMVEQLQQQGISAQIQAE